MAGALDKVSAIRLFPLLAILFASFVAGPAAAQNVPVIPVHGDEVDSSPWLDMPEMFLSERAVATCSYGAVLGMGAAFLTSFIDVGVNLGLQLILGGAIVGCGAWLGEIAGEHFQWHWDRKHPTPEHDAGDAARREESAGPAISVALPAQP